jgi:hypothetical protein
MREEPAPRGLAAAGFRQLLERRRKTMRRRRRGFGSY